MADDKGKSGGKKKLHLHAITTTKLHDGSFAHEHTYKDSKDADFHHPPRLMATSRDLKDVHDHMDDNFGGGAEPEPEAGDPAEAADPAAEAGAPAPAAAPAAAAPAQA